MKNMITSIASVLVFGFTSFCEAQILKDLDKRVENKAKQRVNRKIDKTIDKGFDEVEGVGTEVSKNNGKSTGEKDGKTDDAEGKAGENNEASETFNVTSKFDFVAGDKALAVDDFSRVTVGDFPADWHTNGSGEVVTIDGFEGPWLEMRGNFSYYPEFIKVLPENFTLEYDLVYNYDTKWLVKSIFGIYFIAADEKTKNEPAFRYGFNKPGKSGAAIEFESYKPNRLNIFTWSNKKVDLDNKTVSEVSFIKEMRNKKMHVSIWRQKDRVRMYLNEQKIVDAPRLLSTDEKYNMIKFAYEDKGDAGRAYIANVRFAESTPDLRAKLIDEGRFATSGIYFATNSDEIKPESYGVLKEIAGILKSAENVKIRIIGHTDSDGSEDANLSLSKKRALAVKNALQNQFGIESSRMETDGKGETAPISPNTTDAGKANNRRVEFVKL